MSDPVTKVSVQMMHGTEGHLHVFFDCTSEWLENGQLLRVWGKVNGKDIVMDFPAHAVSWIKDEEI